MTTRAFCIVNLVSIKFDEDVIQWDITEKELFDIRSGRNIVVFNIVFERVLYSLSEYDLTDEEYRFIRDTFWSYLFKVKR
jgi:hypothetical protein